MIDFFGPGFDAAERLGLLGDLERIHYPVDELTYVNPDGERAFGISYPSLRKRLFRGRHFNFLRGDLEEVLRTALGGSGEIAWGLSVVAVEQDRDGIEVELSDGSIERFDVGIGADGVDSHLRELVFGPEQQFEIPLHHTTAAFLIDGVPGGLGARDFTMLTTPGRMVAVYPIRGGRAATFFVHRDNLAPREATPEEAMAEVYGRIGWIVPELLDGLDPASLFFDRVSQIHMSGWTAGRIALCGDAAWCVSLMAGQGASLALAGGEALGRALGEGGDDVPGTLRRWEGSLRSDVEQRRKAGADTARWFVPETRRRMFVRDLVLRSSAMPVLAALARRQIGVGRPGT